MDWSQLGTILWLRWRLSRNQWCRGGKLNALLTTIAVGIGLAIGAAGGLGGVLAGTFALAKASPLVMLAVWDGIVAAFLFFWMIGIVTEIQRSETIDIGRMLHLPISLRGIFLVNYLASHLTLSIILFLPAMLGLCLGLILGGEWSMIWMFPLVLGLAFMVTAWTYCLRGWLVTLMVNKRRRRAIIAGITFTFVLLSQLPNLLGNFLHDPERHRPRPAISAPPDGQTATRPVGGDKVRLPPTVLAAHKYVPFLWVGNGAMSLAAGNVWPAVLGAAGAFGIGGLGLRRAYRTTLRFYQGQARRPSGGQAASKKSAQRPKAAKVTAGRTLLERRLPGVPDEAAALGLAFLRSMMRAPEVKMALATNFAMLLIFGAMILLRRSAALGDPVKPFILTGAGVHVSRHEPAHVQSVRLRPGRVPPARPAAGAAKVDPDGKESCVPADCARNGADHSRAGDARSAYLADGLSCRRFSVSGGFPDCQPGGKSSVRAGSSPRRCRVVEADKNVRDDDGADLRVAFAVSGGDDAAVYSAAFGAALVPSGLAARRAGESLALGGLVGIARPLVQAQPGSFRRAVAATGKANPSGRH